MPFKPQGVWCVMRGCGVWETRKEGGGVLQQWGVLDFAGGIVVHVIAGSGLRFLCGQTDLCREGALQLCLFSPRSWRAISSRDRPSSHSEVRNPFPSGGHASRRLEIPEKHQKHRVEAACGPAVRQKLDVHEIQPRGLRGGVDLEYIGFGDGECSSVGRALDCGSRGRGFKPRHSPLLTKKAGLWARLFL